MYLVIFWHITRAKVHFLLSRSKGADSLPHSTAPAGSIGSGLVDPSIVPSGPIERRSCGTYGRRERSFKFVKIPVFDLRVQ